jgi:CRISPR-associated protein Csm2
MVSDLYSQVTLNNTGTLTADMQDSLRSMRVRLVYECGRERAVNDFVQRAKLLPYLQGIGDDRQKFLRFARYMEALVAYHRYHGGKD